MRQNFKDINIFSGFGQKNGQDWQKENGITANWKTPEQIDIQPVYTQEDLEGMEHLDFAAGIPPFLRGPYSMMYPFRPWTIRQYAGFSTAEVTHSTAATWLADRKVCPWLSTSRHIVATTQTTNVW